MKDVPPVVTPKVTAKDLVDRFIPYSQVAFVFVSATGFLIAGIRLVVSLKAEMNVMEEKLKRAVSDAQKETAERFLSLSQLVSLFSHFLPFQNY